jgi:hypothetical protein
LAVFLSPQLTDESLTIRLLYANAALSMLSLVAYHMLWTPPETPIAAAASQPSAPAPLPENVEEKPERTPESIKSLDSVTIEKRKESNNPKDRTALAIKAGTVDLVVVVSPLIPEPNLKPAHPDDLDFYFFPLMAAFFDDKVQYATVTITNRTPQKMHLELWGHVNYWKDNGEPTRLGVRADWNPEGFKARTGDDFIDLDPWETKKGRVLITLGKTEDREIERWFVDVSEDVYLEFFDTVTGNRSAFKAMQGYPLGQVEAPILPVKELLALDFPLATTPVKSKPEALDLVLRTSDLTYSNSPEATEKAIQALIRNYSHDPMELSFNLLVCDPPGGGNWQSCEGSIQFVKDLPYLSSVTVEAGATVKHRLKFDLNDIAAGKSEDWQPSELPNECLLEIHDRISGKTVWCAIHSGYPPSTDMRAFTIKRKSSGNLNNPPTDEPNTP